MQAAATLIINPGTHTQSRLCFCCMLCVCVLQACVGPGDVVMFWGCQGAQRAAVQVTAAGSGLEAAATHTHQWGVHGAGGYTRVIANCHDARTSCFACVTSTGKRHYKFQAALPVNTRTHKSLQDTETCSGHWLLAHSPQHQYQSTQHHTSSHEHQYQSKCQYMITSTTVSTTAAVHQHVPTNVTHNLMYRSSY